MDDSRVVSPEGSLDGATLGGLLGYYTAALGSHSRHNSYSSHTSRITYNSHAELTGRQGSREFQWRRSGGPERNCHWGAVESGQESLTSSVCHYPTLPTAFTTTSNGHNGGLKPDAAQPVTRQRLSVQFPVSLLSRFFFAFLPFNQTNTNPTHSFLADY